MNNYYRFKWYIIALLFLGLFILLGMFILSGGGYFTNDGIMYLKIGEYFMNHGSNNTPYVLFDPRIQPPLYPILLGIFSEIISAFHAAFVVNSAFFLIILITLFIILVSISNSSINSFIITTFFAILPPFLFLVITPQPELSALAYKLFMFYLVLRLEKKKEFSNRLVILFGLSTILLLLTRIEQIIFVIFLIIYLLFRYRSNYKKIIPFVIIPVVLVMLIQMLFFYQQTNRWVLFPKIKYNIYLGKIIKKQLNSLPEDQVKNTFPEDAFVSVWFKYDEQKKTVLTKNVFNYIKDSEKDIYISKSNNKSFKNFLLLIFKNMLDVVFFLFWISPFLPIFFILGLLTFIVSKQHRKDIFLLLIFFIGDLYFILSHVEVRFVIVAVPWILIAFIFYVNTLKFRVKYLTYLLSFILLINFVVAFQKTKYINEIRYVPQKQLKEKLKNIKQEVRKNSNMASRHQLIPFYMHLNYFPLPITTIPNLKEYIKYRKIRYIVLDRDVYDLYKEYYPIFNEEESDFKLITTINTDDETIKIFQFVGQ